MATASILSSVSISLAIVRIGFDVAREDTLSSAGEGRVLILTPVKNAASMLSTYAGNLESLTYPREKLSLGLLESDSGDGTWELLDSLRPRLGARCSRVVTVKRDFGFHMPRDTPRWNPAFQLARRNVLARSRNQLLFRALADEEWALWLDVDVVHYPADLVERLLAVGRDIVHPHCVTRYGGETFDLNAWSHHGSKIMSDYRGAGGPVRLDAVGGTVLLVRADLHRDGLTFPPFRYGLRSARIRPTHPVWGAGEIETEGLGIMAQDMGYQCWGLPVLEVIHAPE